MNLILWGKGSSAAVPFSTLVALLALWFGVSVPLTFVGAYFGFRKRMIEHPVRTNQIPRQIPEQTIYTQAIPGIIMGGVLPFGCIFIQLFFILNSIWWAPFLPITRNVKFLSLQNVSWRREFVYISGLVRCTICSAFFSWYLSSW